MNENDVIIDVKDLHKSYGQTEVIKGVDMTVRKGEVICIIGPSGAGKSTILRCLNGLEQATGGKIVVNGHDLTDSHVNIDQVREQVGMVFQHFNLFNNMSVIDNITLAPKLVHHETDEQARAHAMELLKTVGLAEKADAMPKSLSGGQKQRVAIAGDESEGDAVRRGDIRARPGNGGRCARSDSRPCRQRHDHGAGDP